MTDMLYYTELRKLGIEVRKQLKEDTSGKIRQEFRDVIVMLDELNRTASKEGILSLDEYVEGSTLDEMPMAEELKKMLSLVICGTGSEIVENITLQRYFVNDYKGFEGDMMLLYLRAVMEIQKCDRGLDFNILKSCIPNQLGKEVDIILADQQKKREEERRWKELYTQEIEVYKGQPDYRMLKILSRVICDMSDEDICILLKDVDYRCLVTALKGLKGDAVKKIYGTYSNRLANQLYEEMECMESVSLQDISESVTKIIDVILRLMKSGDITTVPKEFARFYDEV